MAAYHRTVFCDVDRNHRREGLLDVCQFRNETSRQTRDKPLTLSSVVHGVIVSWLVWDESPKPTNCGTDDLSCSMLR